MPLLALVLATTGQRSTLAAERVRSGVDLERRGGGGGGSDPLETLLERVDGRTVRKHQLALQQIADLNGGTRAAGTAGYDESVVYMVERLSAAGYDLTLQPFPFSAWLPEGPSTVQQVSPAPVDYEDGTDFRVMTWSPPGNVTARVQAVDLRPALPQLSTSGCEPEDFTDFVPGSIALLQRGACTFRQKAENAANAGATAVIVFNQGNTDDRRGLFDSSVGSAFAGGIPVFATSFSQGVTWAQLPDLHLRVVANVFRGVLETLNVIAERPGSEPGPVVMGGAHLDSVRGGPGRQDNGSGSAALLAIAEALADFPTARPIRFAWWGAEESGLIGSYHYVNNLSDPERNALGLYINLDMIGSPNFVRFILDSDGSTFGSPGAEGSGAVEASFEAFFASRGIPVEPAILSFRSDYAAFHQAGIPVGGLFTRAEGVKTPQQALVHGGTAGAPYDGCYHEACDDFDNVAVDALETNAQAAANTLFRFATDRDQLPVPSKRRSRPGKAPAGAGCHGHTAPATE